MKNTHVLSIGVTLSLILSLIALGTHFSQDPQNLQGHFTLTKQPISPPQGEPDLTPPAWDSFTDTKTLTTFANGTCTITSPASHLIRFTVTDNIPVATGINTNPSSVFVSYVSTIPYTPTLYSGTMGSPSAVFQVTLPDNGYVTPTPLYVTFKDVAGNQGNRYEYVFSLDGTPPCFEQVGLPAQPTDVLKAKVRASISSSTVTPTINDTPTDITFNINGPANYQITTTSNPSLTCTNIGTPQNPILKCTTGNLNLPLGSYTYDLSAKDIQNNIGHTTGSFIVQ